jgi:hypothetical protein
MLVSSLVAVDSDGTTSTATEMGLINVAATDTAGVMVANPPAGRFSTAAAVTPGVTVAAAAASLMLLIDAAIDGAAEMATTPAPVRTPAATKTFGVTVMREPRWISAHQPVIWKEVTDYSPVL